MARIRIAGTLYPYDDATVDVMIERTLLDIWNGDPGEAGKCMNAQCIIRNGGQFPHRVIAAAVIRTRVYIMDTPDHAVRYVLSANKDKADIDRHDTLAIAVPAQLTLRAPTGREIKGAQHNLTNPPTGSHTPTSAGHAMARGEEARLAAAVGANLKGDK